MLLKLIFTNKFSYFQIKNPINLKKLTNCKSGMCNLSFFYTVKPSFVKWFKLTHLIVF